MPPPQHAAAAASSAAVARPSFPLLAIVFAEFDNTVGPKITCQEPPGFLSDEIFDSISDLIITGAELCHKLVTTRVGPYHIIGYPMQLSNKKYHRNALLFNVAFVFPRTLTAGAGVTAGGAVESGSSGLEQLTSMQLRPYHPVIRKLATIIETMEIEVAWATTSQQKRGEETRTVRSVARCLSACLPACSICVCAERVSVPSRVEARAAGCGEQDLSCAQRMRRVQCARRHAA